MAIFDAEGHAWRGFSIAIVWEEILTGIFSTIGRLEHLARCFDPQTRVYTQTKLAPGTAPAELDIAMRAVHRLVWKDWLRGSLEQQQTDLRVYASEA